MSSRVAPAVAVMGTHSLPEHNVLACCIVSGRILPTLRNPGACFSYTFSIILRACGLWGVVQT